MKVTLSQRFTFDSAHTLPLGEGNQRIHGHTYHAEFSLSGEPDPETGMLADLALMRNAAESIRDALDHRLLDEVEGLGLPTIENLCIYIAQRLGRFPAFTSAKVWRADGGRCEVQA